MIAASRNSVQTRYVALESPTGPRLPVGSLPCQGVWHTPNAAGTPKIGLIATHYSADMSGHFLAERIARRGHGFLGWNTRFRGAEDMFSLGHALTDLGAGVRWMRQAGVETVVLLGNSGGGSLMAAYQSQASARILPATGDAKLDAALADLPVGDRYVSLNAHLGRPEYLTAIMDPSVVDEFDPVAVDPDLDMYNRANGPPYSADFIVRYRAAQERRNRRITAWAEAELARLARHGHTDRIFSVPRVWADPRFLDPGLDPSDRTPGLCYGGDPRAANRGAAGMARATTLKSWLGMFSLDRSQCRAAAHLANIKVPSLVVQTTHDVGVFPSDARAIHQQLGAEDRALVLRPGSHFLDFPDGARDDVADLIVDWLEQGAV